MTRITPLLLLFCVACAAETAVRVEPNPVRQAWEQRLGKLDRLAPLDLRFNPAPCNCPPFELRLDDRWLRAELASSDSDRLATWLAFLTALPEEAGPAVVQVRGRVDRDVVRTAQGDYAVRVEVTEIVAPLPPPVEPIAPEAEARPAPAP
jgi:hypothetical protein